MKESSASSAVQRNRCRLANPHLRCSIVCFADGLIHIQTENSFAKSPLPIIVIPRIATCSALPQFSQTFAYREASLRFYAHVGRVSRSCTPLCKHRRARTFRPYKHKKVPGRIFQTHRTKRDVRSTFIRLFGTCISLPLKRIHLKIKGEVFWLGVSLLVFLLSFRQWLLTIRHPYSSKDCRRFTLRSLFPSIYSLFSFRRKDRLLFVV